MAGVGDLREGAKRGQKGEASQAHGNENEKSQLQTLWKSCW
jgi:hypothetical protein